MKYITTIVLALAAFYCQAQTLDKAVIGSSSIESNTLSSTAGEVAVTTYTNGNLTLSEGFHNGNFTLTSIDNLPTLEGKIDAYPNPVKNNFTLTLNLKEKFTEFGSLKENSNYDNSGELIQNDIYEYDENDLLQKMISTNKRVQIGYIMTVYNDTINKTSTRKVVVNDSLNQEITVYYNDSDYVVKQIAIEQNDTIIAKHEYQFNEADKLVLERQVDIESKKPIVTNEYSYDENGNLNRYSYKMEWAELITETEWENQRISKQTEYTVKADLKKHLDQITEFDRFFNQTNTKTYENSELKRELKFEYEFDEKGNWTKREVSMKEHFENSKEFKPIYSETREIKYWE